MADERDHEVSPGFRVHEVSDEELAAASPEYREHLSKRVELGSSPPGWPINNEVLVDLGRLLDDGVILGTQQQRWLVAAANALSDALGDERSERRFWAPRLLATEPRTPERLSAAIDLGELILCQAETNANATPEEIEQLSDALAGSTLAETVSLVVEGMRS